MPCRKQQDQRNAKTASGAVLLPVKHHYGANGHHKTGNLESRGHLLEKQDGHHKRHQQTQLHKQRGQNNAVFPGTDLQQNQTTQQDCAIE